jgi:hypothetical protein
LKLWRDRPEVGQGNAVGARDPARRAIHAIARSGSNSAIWIAFNAAPFSN